jgi:hypothetical protein
MRSKIFLIGFLIWLALFVAANLYSYIHMGSSGGGTCDDCFSSFGFPFALWIEGGFVSVAHILWGGLIADASVAMCAGIALGLAVEKLFGVGRRLP